MVLCVFFFVVLVLFHAHIRCTDQRLIVSLATSAVQKNTSLNTPDECLERVLLESHAQHVRLVCGSNAVHCPSTIVTKHHAMSWMLFNRNGHVGFHDRRHYCVLAGDSVTHLHDLLTSNQICSQEKLVLVIPWGVPGQPPAMETLFSAAWEVGIVDAIVVLTDSRCPSSRITQSASTAVLIVQISALFQSLLGPKAQRLATEATSRFFQNTK